MKLPVNKQNLKKGATVAAYVGVGAVIAQVGSEVAKRASSQVAGFANKSATNEAIVDAGAGVLGAAIGLLVFAKLKSPAAAAQAAPFVIGGGLLSAGAPLALPYVQRAVDGIVGAVLPNRAAPQGALPDNVRRMLPRAVGGNGFAVESYAGLQDVLPGGQAHDLF